MPKPAEIFAKAKEANIGELIANIPFIADLVEVLKSYCHGFYFDPHILYFQLTAQPSSSKEMSPSPSTDNSQM
jgi:hypothetical protein